jgi:hypothetical protein
MLSAKADRQRIPFFGPIIFPMPDAFSTFEIYA